MYFVFKKQKENTEKYKVFGGKFLIDLKRHESEKNIDSRKKNFQEIFKSFVSQE